MTNDQDDDAIPLHLHTLESLVSELVSGRSVLLGADSKPFRFKDKETRAILGWFAENRSRWRGNANDADAWATVRAAYSEPPKHPALTLGSRGGIPPRYCVKRVRAHCFAGLHEYGEECDIEYDLVNGATVFEGKNGSGKTSLLNALIWCLTGKVLRAQQWPQPGDTVVDLKAGEGENEIAAKSVAVSPMPPDSVVKTKANKSVPIDTWVEVVLVDADGKELPSLKRRIYTNNTGKVIQDTPNLSSLTLPPTAFETGTCMPGILPMIQIGEKNDIGKAIAELTGFNDLRDLADRARRLQDRMIRTMTNKIDSNVDELQILFSFSWKELSKRFQNNETLKPAPKEEYPFLETAPKNNEDLQKLRGHFVSLEAQAFERVQDILGTDFDPTDESMRNELRSNVGQALGLIDFTVISRLNSAHRLSRIKNLTDEEEVSAIGLIESVFDEYQELARLAANADLAARERLYSRVAEWIRESDTENYHLENCALCKTALEGRMDTITGVSIRDHLRKRLDEPSDFFAFTLDAWRDHTEQRLSHELPVALRNEAGRDLPYSPPDLMKMALTEELFSQRPFQGSLAALKIKVDSLCEEHFTKLPAFKEPQPLKLPSEFETRFPDLFAKVNRVNRAIAFARWRKQNTDTWGEALKKIIGTQESDEAKTRQLSSLSDMLSALDQIVRNAEPIQLCFKDVDELDATLSSIGKRKNENKLLAFAAAKIAPLLELGNLVDHQMQMLRAELHKETVKWKNLVYLRPSGTAPLHAETHISTEGNLDFSSETKGTRAPSQHVSNASDTRATLFAFLIAFWKHVRDTHGGLDLLVFDDPQELFDRDNQRRLCKTLCQLVREDAQLLIASYVPSFTDSLSGEVRSANAANVAHRSISPITANRPYVSHHLMERNLEINRRVYLNPESGQEDKAAKDYVNELRIYIEDHLSECFPERLPGLSSNDTIGPFVGHIRRLANDGHLPFATPPFQRIADNPIFADRSDVLEILNRSHHRNADTISHNEVRNLEEGLDQAKSLVDNAHMAFELHRMGESSSFGGKRPVLTVPEPTPLESPEIQVDIILDLAAFTNLTVGIEAQKADSALTGDVFTDKALYHLNTHNFGFAAERGDIVIVDTEATSVENGRLVLVRYSDTILAGRLLRDPDRPGLIALGSEAENPLNRPPSNFLPEDAVALHKVTGILFKENVPPDLRKKSIGDAAPIDVFPSLAVQLAFKVRDDSAVPLALPEQVVLGGNALSVEELMNGEGLLVAVSTSDGQQVFKRIGKPIFAGRNDIRIFESIGGKGNSLALALEEEVTDAPIPFIVSARHILGVIYAS